MATIDLTELPLHLDPIGRTPCVAAVHAATPGTPRRAVPGVAASRGSYGVASSNALAAR
jgi:hypothetical protein